MRHVKASDFRAKAHTLVAEVARTGKPLLITKNGKPLVELHPKRPLKRRNAFGVWKDLLIVKGDIISPPGANWDSLKEA